MPKKANIVKPIDRAGFAAAVAEAQRTVAKGAGVYCGDERGLISTSVSVGLRIEEVVSFAVPVDFLGLVGVDRYARRWRMVPATPENKTRVDAVHPELIRLEVRMASVQPGDGGFIERTLHKAHGRGGWFRMHDWIGLPIDAEAR